MNSTLSTQLEAFQVFGSGFVVILLSGVLAEARWTRDAGNEDGRRSRALVLLFVLIAVAVVVGEIITTMVLLNGRMPSRTLRAIDIALFVGGVALVGAVGIGPLLDRITFSVTLAIICIVVIAAAVGVILSRPKKYEIYGTCASGRCGLNVRSAPTSHSQPLGQKVDGNEITILCQTNGMRLTASNGVRSIVWDKLSSGGFVSDLYVDTPKVGQYSPGLRGCSTSERHAYG